MLLGILLLAGIDLPAQTPEKNKETVRKLYEDCLNTGNLELLNQFISEDYVADIRGKKIRGPSGFTETVREILHGFPDIRFTVEDLIAEGDMVVVKWTSQGTHTGSFMVFPASGKQVANHAVAIYQFRDNKIIQSSVYPDRLGVLQQIGLIPRDLRSLALSPDTSN